MCLVSPSMVSAGDLGPSRASGDWPSDAAAHLVLYLRDMSGMVQGNDQVLDIPGVFFEVFGMSGISQHLEGWVMLYNIPPCYITGCCIPF
jgi:hypothetical protein